MADQRRRALLFVVAMAALAFATVEGQSVGWKTFASASDGSGNVLYSLDAPDNATFNLKTIHTHPRGWELVMVASGAVEAGYITEANKLISTTVTPDNVFLVPQGLAHYVINKNCQPALAYFVFPPNPGVQFILAAASAIPQNTLSYFASAAVPAEKGNLFTNTDASCASRCGIASAAKPASG